MVGASRKSRLRHYLNLGKTEERFRRLLRDFSFSPILEGLGGSLAPKEVLRKQASAINRPGSVAAGTVG
jgi:hypothetical protein